MMGLKKNNIVGNQNLQKNRGPTEVINRKEREFDADKIIQDYIKNQDVAPWFRGTSHYHILGSEGLFNALRDDGEQKTTHRVRTCLTLIGLKPIISSKQITFLMRISRGNDLVFLWFLMEMHYKTPKDNPKSYSVNEQLICSAICHLDMVTTLRELDRILPKGHSSKTEMENARKIRQKLRESHFKQQKKKTKNEYVLPYFEKNPRAKHYGKRLIIEEPNFIVSFEAYSPIHTVQNETNRWYADYCFRPSKRIAHLVINEVMNNIFCNYEKVSSRLKTTDVLCAKHRARKIALEKVKHLLNVKERNMCLKYYLNWDENEEIVKKEKVLNMIDEAVKQQFCTFKAQSWLLGHRMTIKTITSDEKIVNLILGANAPCDCEDKIQFDDTLPAITQGVKKKDETCAPPKEFLEYKNPYDCENIRDCKPQKMDQQCVENKVHEINTTSANYDYCDPSSTPSPSTTVFHRPTEHKPFTFDYKKIFDFTSKCDTKWPIRKMFLTALDQDMCDFSTDLDDSSVIYEEAVKNCALRTFKSAVHKYEVRKKYGIGARDTGDLGPLSQYHSFAVYNPENYEQMEKMLFDAFQYLRKNPKFVWAQLPDAHKLPQLREWIARRYGKEYSPAQRVQSYKNSCVLFRALEQSRFKFKFPTASQIGKNFFLSYDCRKHVERKMRRLKNKFYHHLDSTLLERTHIFWFAMRGYICSNGPPRKTFYAYMPSRFRDIQHFRLWKSSEYRNITRNR